MKQAIGITVHYDDQTTLKVPVAGFQFVIGGQGGQNTYLNADACPTHGAWRAVDAGVSKGTGKPYPAFWACDQEQGEARCTNKPAREWVETHPPGGVAPDQAPTPEPTGPTSGTEFDSLDF